MVSPLYIDPQLFFQECDSSKTSPTSAAVMWLLSSEFLCFNHEPLELNRLPHILQILLSCMRSYMPCQVRCIKESFPADLARERLLTCVGTSHVDYQGTTLYKTSPTCFAGIWLLTCVDSYMNVQR